MDLKKVLKNVKLNENNISMLLGAAVVVIVGFLVVNYFRNIDSGTTLQTGTTTTADSTVKLPTKHTVVAGETLWSIAEKYYKSGYNWIDIQKENNLTNASVITNGQELIIPDVEAKTMTIANATPVATTSATPEVSATPKATVVASATPAATITPAPTTTTKGGLPTGETVSTQNPISGSEYTVSKGDSLWTIAVRAYGNGYKWSEIAKANKLSHPGVIHAGNVLQIPR